MFIQTNAAGQVKTQARQDTRMEPVPDSDEVVFLACQIARRSDLFYEYCNMPVKGRMNLLLAWMGQPLSQASSPDMRFLQRVMDGLCTQPSFQTEGERHGGTMRAPTEQEREQTRGTPYSKPSGQAATQTDYTGYAVAGAVGIAAGYILRGMLKK